MSKLEPSWTADLMRAAKLDGWLLAWCINSGHSINRAYLEIFEHGPRFEDREKAVRHVVQEARYGKKLHITAMTAVLHTRAAANKRKR